MPEKCVANDNHIVISFKYSLKDKRYTIDAKLGGKSKCNKDLQMLFEKLVTISHTSWQELKSRPREVGYEMIPVSEFHINMGNIKKELELSEDSKIIVFRFGTSQKYRLFGVRCKGCSSILYIIGYDWDYSAYNHG